MGNVSGAVAMTTARAALACPTCGFYLSGMPRAEAFQVERCLACGLRPLLVVPVPEDAPRHARWGEFPI